MHVLRTQLWVEPVGQACSRLSVLDEYVNYPALMLYGIEKSGSRRGDFSKPLDTHRLDLVSDVRQP